MNYFKLQEGVHRPAAWARRAFAARHNTPRRPPPTRRPLPPNPLCEPRDYRFSGTFSALHPISDAGGRFFAFGEDRPCQLPLEILFLAHHKDELLQHFGQLQHIGPTHLKGDTMTKKYFLWETALTLSPSEQSFVQGKSNALMRDHTDAALIEPLVKTYVVKVN